MRSSAAVPLSIALVAAASAARGAGPTPGVAVERELRAEIDVSLLLDEEGGQRLVHAAHLSGAPGAPIPMTASIEATPPLQAVLAIVPRTAGAPERCRLELDSRVRSGAGPPARLRRELAGRSGSVVLIDLWSGGPGRRLVAAVTCRWTERPRIVPFTGARAEIEVTLELLAEDDRGAERVLERHRLRGLVGSPLSYAMERREQGTRGAVTLDLLPRAIEEGRLRLEVHLHGPGPDGAAGSLDLRLRDALPSGASLDLPLPASGKGPRLSFRIRPSF